MDYNHLLRNMDYCELLTLTERWLWLMLVSGKCMGIASRQVYPQWHPAGREVLQGKHYDLPPRSQGWPQPKQLLALFLCQQVKLCPCGLYHEIDD